VHSDTLYVKKTKETKARKKNKIATVKNLCVKKKYKKNKKKKTAIEKQNQKQKKARKKMKKN
jgi:hypothetical protein